MSRQEPSSVHAPWADVFPTQLYLKSLTQVSLTPGFSAKHVAEADGSREDDRKPQGLPGLCCLPV